jgi:hypothetical protein
MASISKSSLVTVTRDGYFSENISVSGTNVTSVVCIFQGDPEKNLKIETSNTNIRIYGNYKNQYKDQIIYVEKGASANLDLGLSFLQQQKIITVLNSVADVPPGKDLLQFSQDISNQYLEVTYKVFVNDLSGNSEFELEQRINNDFSFGTNFLKSYFPTLPGEIPPKFKVEDYTIYDNGKNYFVGNTFVVPGGTGNSAVISVSQVNANGNVLSISIDNPGSYTEAPTITYQYHSNTGSNLVIGLVMGTE